MALPAAAAAAASATVAAFDKTAPLAAALLRKGLTEQQIVQDNWTAMMSLPHDASTLDVLKVKPSSPLSCDMWCGVVA
jgi:hypothetical protein